MGVLQGLAFGGIWPHAFSGEHCTIKDDLGLSHMAFKVAENDTMLGCCLHKLQEVPVMFLRGAAVNVYIIVNGNNAREAVSYLVHAHLKDILRHFQAKRHAQEPVPAMVCFKSG